MDAVPLLTLREIKRKYFSNIPIFTLKYAIDVHNVEPRQRAGMVRMYGEDQVNDIADALRLTGQRRGVVRPGVVLRG